jgi:glucosamine--fructose-6-phosphate aminotransferase (isomerizing)
MTHASQRMSAMALELAESPHAVRAGASDDYVLRDVFSQLKACFESKPPSLIVLCGRGSSGHACVFLRYLIETKLGVPTALFAPSVVTAYGARPRLQDAWFLTITQSGGSPDLAAAMRAARESGALSLALVNVAGSAVAEEAQIVLPLRGRMLNLNRMVKNLISELI